MEETKIICSSCGASVAVKGKSVRCPYCGGITTRPKPKGADLTDAKINDEIFVIYPTFSESDFDASYKENVLNKDPEYISNVTSTARFFYIFNRHYGSYSGSFTCRAGRERVHYVQHRNEQSTWNERMVDIEYEPFQAQLKGKFGIDVLATVVTDFFDKHNEIIGIDNSQRTMTLEASTRLNELQDIEDMCLDVFTNGRVFLEASTKTQELRSVDIDEFATEFDLDVEKIAEAIEDAISTDDNRLHALIADQVQRAAVKQAPAPSKNISATFDHSINNVVTFVAAFYTRKYKHIDKLEFFIVDAGDGSFFGAVDEPEFP